jgi:hypothetical protein
MVFPDLKALSPGAHRFKLIIWLIVSLSSLVGCASSDRKPENNSNFFVNFFHRQELPSDRPTALELQARLMSFADRYLAKSSQGTENYLKAVKTREAKEFALSTFVFPGLTVISIAAGDDPASDLTDMLVFVSLQREVMESGWAQEILGSHARELIAIQKNLEDQIWLIASEVLEQKQQTELRRLIQVWRQANPQQRVVTGVRFDDVAKIRGKNTYSKSLHDFSGLLAPIDKAVEETDAMRLLAERGIFLSERMPRLLMAQARNIAHEQIAPEEIDKLVADFSAMSRSVSKAERDFAGLPQVLAKERQAWLKALDQRQHQVVAMLNNSVPALEASKNASADIRETLKQFETLIQAYDKNGKAINDTLTKYQNLLQFMDNEPPTDTSKLLSVLEAFIRLGQQIDRLGARLQPSSGQGLDVILLNTYEKMLNSLFWRLLLVFAALLLMIFAYRYLCRRYLDISQPRDNPS